MSALDRSTVHDEVAARIRILDDVKRVPMDRWLTYATEHSLPSDPGRCSTEALLQARTQFYAPGGATHMALKTTGTKGIKTTTAPVTGKPALAASTPAKNPAKRFLVAFPEGKPQRTVGVLLVGDPPTPPAKTLQTVVSSHKDLLELPMQALLALVNAGKPGTPIRQFNNVDSAATSAWDALLARSETPAIDGATKSATPPKTRTPKPVLYPPKADTKEALKQVREGTKIAKALDLLSRDGGVLMTEFENELSKTGKPISARSWLGYDVNSVTGYGVKSEPDGDDLRLYLTYPKGMRKPLAHLAPKSAPVPKTPKPKTEAPKSATDAA